MHTQQRVGLGVVHGGLTLTAFAIAMALSPHFLPVGPVLALGVPIALLGGTAIVMASGRGRAPARAAIVSVACSVAAIAVGVLLAIVVGSPAPLFVVALAPLVVLSGFLLADPANRTHA